MDRDIVELLFDRAERRSLSSIAYTADCKLDRSAAELIRFLRRELKEERDANAAMRAALVKCRDAISDDINGPAMVRGIVLEALKGGK